MTKPDLITIRVRDWVGQLGALEPDQGAQLARHLVERSTRAVLDFAGAGPVSSGFANAFFVELAAARPLHEWRKDLEFVGLDSRQAEVMARSLKAARNASTHGIGAACKH